MTSYSMLYYINCKLLLLHHPDLMKVVNVPETGNYVSIIADIERVYTRKVVFE